MNKENNEKKTLLIVDDSQSKRQILVSLLEKDYDLLVAENGDQAMKLLREHSSRISLVLMDIVMPGRTGLDVLDEIKQVPEWMDIPVVMISSGDPEKFEGRALALGAADYVIRPYDITFLKKRIKNNITIAAMQRTEKRLNESENNEKSPVVTNEYLVNMLHCLKELYDTVRLVDVEEMIAYSLQDNRIHQESRRCFEIWGKQGRCENCISAKAFQDHGRHTKFEFIGKEIYQNESRYVEVDGVPFVLELLNKADDEVFLDAVGRDMLVQSVLEQNQKLYIDALTGVYNRFYFEEQLKQFAVSAMAMIDIDHFKRINDTYGHLAGDIVLHSVAQTVQQQIRKTDALIRYGGDEFLLIFVGIRREFLEDKLNRIRESVERLTFDECPGEKITISIGAIVTDNCGNEAVSRADQMMYKAKKTRNYVAIE